MNWISSLTFVKIVNLRQIRELFLQFRTSIKSLESENEDLHKVIKSLANGGAVNGNFAVYGQTGVTRGSFLNIDRNGETKDDGREEGVGDVEGGGFGVGLVKIRKKNEDVW